LFSFFLTIAEILAQAAGFALVCFTLAGDSNNLASLYRSSFVGGVILLFLPTLVIGIPRALVFCKRADAGVVASSAGRNDNSTFDDSPRNLTERRPLRRAPTRTTFSDAQQ
jgi:hypothetical protein